MGVVLVHIVHKGNLFLFFILQVNKQTPLLVITVTRLLYSIWPQKRGKAWAIASPLVQ